VVNIFNPFPKEDGSTHLVPHFATSLVKVS